MPNSIEIRHLMRKWRRNSGWPKRLEWIEISGLRGWTGHRIEFNFPIVAIVGENGSGKSTILQAAAAIYHSPESDKKLYASVFFPDTPWDRIKNVEIKSSVREENSSRIVKVRKPTDRWRGNQERRHRKVYYIDLSRIQPFSTRLGYSKLTKSTLHEGTSRDLTDKARERLSQILGKSYSIARFSTIESDPTRRKIPVMQQGTQSYSGFHQGAGEITAAELIDYEFEPYSLVIIDEVESSLHPRAQRRLIRDLADISRQNDVQFIISTHSPYVLEEIPPEGRIYIVENEGVKSTVIGVSPEFAMSKMDDADHPECDVYVEDFVAKILLNEIIVHKNPDILSRLLITPYGAASVGLSLGIMVTNKCFSRPTIVFLDGDQDPASGIERLPGEDAPERVVFEALSKKRWPSIAERIDRDGSTVIDALARAMTITNHHEWLKAAATPLHLGTEELWRVMCASWVKYCADQDELESILLKIQDVLPN